MVDAAISEHVIGGAVLLPGVGFVEMAMAFSRASQPALDALGFIRPCVLPGLETGLLNQDRLCAELLTIPTPQRAGSSPLQGEQIPHVLQVSEIQKLFGAVHILETRGRQQSLDCVSE